MATALDRIIAYKLDEVAVLKAEKRIAELDLQARSARATRGFAQSMTSTVQAGKNALICELKRKSPSAGDILLGADPEAVARAYENGGAACLSVLTDYPSFGGRNEDLLAVSETVSLPIIRKDFMVDTIQIVEARSIGADAILIIMAALDDALAADLLACATDYGMDAIVEVHDAEEMERAQAIGSTLIGINNRNLKTMTTSLQTSLDLVDQFGSDCHTFISESGVKSPEDIRFLRQGGFRRYLIGESLMKEEDQAAAVKRLAEAI